MPRVTPRRRRLLFYAGGFAPIGGIEAFARDLLVALARSPWDRRVVAWGPRGALLETIAQSGARVTRSPWRWGCRWGVPDHVLLPLGLRAIRGADLVLFGKAFAPSLHRWLRRAGLRPRRRIPLVYVTPYRPQELWPAGPPPGLLETFDAVIVQARSFVDDLRRVGYGGRVEVIPYVPPLAVADVSEHPPGQGVIRIGFLGRLEPQKNLDYLLQSFSVLVRKTAADQAWELHLFGDGSERPRLEREAARLKLGERVRFHGAVAGEAVPRAIDSCHLFASTSTTEGQCLVALEVLARGRPIVATPVGALPEILGDPVFGRLAPLGAPEAFAAALAAVGTSARNGGPAARTVRDRYAERFDRDAVIAHYARLFDELVGAP